MRITKIEPQKRHPGRTNIYADDKFLTGVSKETLLRLALRIGDEISPDTIRILQQTEEQLSAKNTALRYLSYRPRTEREVRDKLREREFDDAQIAATLADLKAAGLINDVEFCRMFIRDTLSVRPTGKILIKKKLLMLGVQKETVDIVLEESFKEVNQGGAAFAAAQHFLKRTRSPGKNEPTVKLRNRLTAFLIRRGYTWEIIGTVVKTILKDNNRTENYHE